MMLAGHYIALSGGKHCSKIVMAHPTLVCFLSCVYLRHARHGLLKVSLSPRDLALNYDGAIVQQYSTEYE